MSDAVKDNQKSPFYELLQKQKRLMIFFFLLFIASVGFLAEDYVRQERLTVACNRLEESEEFVNVNGKIGADVLVDYLEKLDEARTAFFVLTEKNPRDPNYKDYLDRTDYLIKWAKENKSRVGFLYKRLYYSACF